MKKLIYTLFLFFIIASVATSCEEEKDYIRLVNHSHQDIYVFDAYDSPEELPNNRAEIGNIINRYYRKGAYKPYTAYFDIDYNLCDTLYLTVLLADTVAKYPWETILKEKKYVTRYTLPFNREYLKSIDYTIRFHDPQ